MLMGSQSDGKHSPS